MEFSGFILRGLRFPTDPILGSSKRLKRSLRIILWWKHLLAQYSPPKLEAGPGTNYLYWLYTAINRGLWLIAPHSTHTLGGVFGSRSHDQCHRRHSKQLPSYSVIPGVCVTNTRSITSSISDQTDPPASPAAPNLHHRQTFINDEQIFSGKNN